MSRWIKLIGLVLLSAFAPVAFCAAAYPDRPVTIVVPYPPGGGNDIMARHIAKDLQGTWHESIIVVNKPGASGIIGANYVAHARPDGYTLLLIPAALAIAPALHKHLDFDPIKSFAPITQLAIVPLVVVTKPDSPLNSMADLIALAKKEGPKVTYATFGPQSPSAMVGGSINLLAKVDMTEIPFKGTSPALPAVMSGRTTVGILDTVSTTPLLKDHRLKALAITGPKRAPSIPDVPTLVESGVNFDTVGWYGLFAPAGTPSAIVEKINHSVNKILAQPSMQKTILHMSSIPVEPQTTVSAWTAGFKKAVSDWASVVHSLHMKPVD